MSLSGLSFPEAEILYDSKEDSFIMRGNPNKGVGQMKMSYATDLYTIVKPKRLKNEWSLCSGLQCWVVARQLHHEMSTWLRWRFFYFFMISVKLENKKWK